MFCTNCGARIGDTDKFCPACGARIERPETTPAGGGGADGTKRSDPGAPSAASYAPAPKKRSHAGLWIALICAVLAIALAAVVIFVWRPWSRCGVPDVPVVDETDEPEAADEPVAEPDPEETVRAALAKMSGVDSLHMDLVENVSVTIGIPSADITQDMDISVVMSIDTDKANGSSRIEGSVSAMGFRQDVLTYTETVDGRMTSYVSTDGGATWTQKDDPDSDGVFSDPTASVDLWMKHAKDLKKTGTELMNGLETSVYAGTLSGEYVKDVAGMLGDAFKDLEEAALNDIGDISITVWIDRESGRVVRIALDLRDMMKTLMETVLKKSMGAASEDVEISVDVAEADAVCDITRFNEIPPIVIPEEAKGLAPEPEPVAEPDSIVGTWTLCGGEDEETQQYADMMLAFGMEMVFVFNEDGTGSMSMTFQGEEDTEEFTYTLEDGEIVIDGDGAPYRIEDGLLYLTADDVRLVFKRK